MRRSLFSAFTIVSTAAAWEAKLPPKEYRLEETVSACDCQRGHRDRFTLSPGQQQVPTLVAPHQVEFGVKSITSSVTGGSANPFDLPFWCQVRTPIFVRERRSLPSPIYPILPSLISLRAAHVSTWAATGSLVTAYSRRSLRAASGGGGARSHCAPRLRLRRISRPRTRSSSLSSLTRTTSSTGRSTASP